MKNLKFTALFLLLLVANCFPVTNAQMNLLESNREAFERRQAEKYYWEKNHPYSINGAPQDLGGNYPNLPPQRGYSQYSAPSSGSGLYGQPQNNGYHRF